MACDPAHAARRRFWINDRISAAALGMLVPGPQIALARARVASIPNPKRLPLVRRPAALRIAGMPDPIEAIFTAEINSDALARTQLMAKATRQIKVGTWIASIHMRHSYACAKAASLIADAIGPFPLVS